MKIVCSEKLQKIAPVQMKLILAHLSVVTRWAFVITFCPSSIVRPCMPPCVHASMNNFFKQHLLLNHWLDFDQTSQEWFLVGPLSKLFRWFQRIAYLVTGAKNRFLTEKLKSLLVRNHWTDFDIILQKCSLDDPLPRLFKPFGFVKSTWPP